MKGKICCFLLILLLFCCSKNSKNTKQTDESNKNRDFAIESYKTDELNTENEEIISTIELSEIINNFSSFEAKSKSKPVKKPVYSVDKLFLKDPLKFKSLDYLKWENKNIGVIAISGVKLYSDMDGKNEVGELPIGTVIELVKKYENPAKIDDGYEGLYKFLDNYNYWYETIFNGKKGFVFGSFLVLDEETLSLAIGDSYRRNEMKLNDKILNLAEYYKEKKFNEFYDFNGTEAIPAEAKKNLEIDKFSLQKVNEEYYLDIDDPDDMISLYSRLKSDRMANVFITTDYLIHCLHLLFNRMLQSTESRTMYPILCSITRDYYNFLVEYETILTESSPLTKESVALMKKYFLVASDLLGIDIIKKTDYPEVVTRELEKIYKAEGFDESEILGYTEDYSQFKPRGHYTKTERLKGYFMSMIWYGRLHFYCKRTSNQAEQAASIKLTRSALLLTKIISENKELLNAWKSLYEPITYIIGESDDYNLDQYLNVSGNVDFKNFSVWAEKDENILEFIDTANKKLPKPRISGNVAGKGNEGFLNKIDEIPAGFRFFGQRFTLDSFIHNQLSHPRIKSFRYMVKGLDIAGVFGNPLADKLLENEKSTLEGYNDNYNVLKNKINGMSDSEWIKTFYNSYLKIIKETYSFDETSGFYFTQSPNWNIKELLTGHGAWAEIRHDTILYVKQNYGEKAGGGPWTTWQITRVERPIAFIEPNLGTIYWIQSILEDTIQILGKNKFYSAAYHEKFTDYLDIIDRLAVIAEKEAKSEPITAEENEFIFEITKLLTKIVLPYPTGERLENDELQMAIIADVYTDTSTNEVLEVGTGKPFRIYVALNDKQGGKRIAEGFTYSYYEFKQPMSDRLNNEQWKEKVYGKDTQYVDERMPSWLKNFVIK